MRLDNDKSAIIERAVQVWNDNPDMEISELAQRFEASMTRPTLAGHLRSRGLYPRRKGVGWAKLRLVAKTPERFDTTRAM